MANGKAPPGFRFSVCVVLAGILAACSTNVEQPDADIVIVGAGIAGLAAAIEAAEAGRSVIVVEANSVPGGHAVKAGGFALVGTALQERRGIADSPDLAATDLIDWSVDGDETWIRRYVEASGPEVHDWLTALGVEFRILIPTPEASVARFHFTAGTAVNVVLPMLRRISAFDHVTFLLNHRATGLRTSDKGVTGVETVDTRKGREQTLAAGAVIIATGGFQGDLDTVRKNWPAGSAWPPTLLNGAGTFADGSGITLATSAGAATHRLDQHVIFPNGLVDPTRPGERRALAVSNDRSIWLDDNGNRFIDEKATPNVVEAAVLESAPGGYWMVFAEADTRRLRVRDASWLTPDTLRQYILEDDEVVLRADDVAALSIATGMPVVKLGRNLSGMEGPWRALRLRPMTRKNLGGITVDEDGRVLDSSDGWITGLYAAGEVTGVAGINGRRGMSGTFLGPSVWQGRLAGAAAASDTESGAGSVAGESGSISAYVPADALAIPPETLPSLIAANRPGYWHFGEVHDLVLHRGLDCGSCHDDGAPTITANGPDVGPNACLTCH